MKKKADLYKQPTEKIFKQTKIFEVINPKLVQAPPTTSLKETVALMQRQKSSYVVIAKNKKVAGIFTEVDLVRKVLDQKINWASPVSQFMTPDPVTLSPNDSISKALATMEQHRLYYVPLVNDLGNLVNVLSVRTLLRFLAEFYPAEIYNLPPDPDQVLTTPEGG